MSYFISLKSQLPYLQKGLCLDESQKITSDSIKPSKNMVVADFDGDGFLDFAIADVSSQQLITYKALGFGQGFVTNNTITLSGIGADNSITSGDYDSDGDIDIAMCYGGNLKILTNNSFTFNLGHTISIPSSSYLPAFTYLKTVDFNKDNKDDILLVGTHVNSNHGVAVLCFRNISPSTSTLNFSLDYQNLVYYGLQSLNINNSIDFDVGDINGDSKSDIIFTYSSKSDTILVLTYSVVSSNINFAENKLATIPSSSVSGFVPKQCCAGDLNNDGIQDLLTFSEKTGANSVSLFLGSTIGLVFSETFSISTFSIPLSIKDFKLKDINDDGYIDFIGITNSTLLIYLQNGASTSFYSSPIILSTPSQLFSEEIEVEDFDNNNLNDIFIKSWKGKKSIPVVIPNFSYKNYITDKGLIICSTQSTSLAANSNVTVSPLINPSYNWYSTSTASILASSSQFTTTTQNNYFYNLNFTFPYTFGTSCLLNSDTVGVIVNNAPTINFTPYTNTTVCYNQVIDVKVFGADTYTWSGGNNLNTNTFTTTAYNNSTYIVSGTDSKGCIGTNTLIINVYPLNTDTIISSKNPICIGDSVKLTFPSTTSYTWSSGNINAPSTTLYPLVNTTYSLTYTYGNNCISYKTIDINVDPLCVLNVGTSVYNSITPNNDGFNDSFFIEGIEHFANNQVTIFNRWGKTLSSIANYDNSTNFWPKKDDFSQLTSTSYFYLINYGNGTIKKGWIEVLKD
ncbi:MAG: FG-GAP-like repeat-containing protein [Bacteroidota bacterium]|nr:FG-GAP-like repeat-containing protein [Bacteroidota bacterium]